MSRLVYLAGPITGLSYEGATDWRKAASDRLLEKGVLAFNPMRGKDYLINETEVSDHYDQHVMSTEKAIMQRDRWDVSRADAVLVNFLGVTKVSIGTVMEIAWADAKRIPIVIAMEEDNIHQHAMIRQASGFIVGTLEEAIHVTTCLFAF